MVSRSGLEFSVQALGLKRQFLGLGWAFKVLRLET